MNTPESIDEYIASQTGTAKERLMAMRTAIQESVPGAKEAIRYGLPTFRLAGKNVVHFAGFAHHIGYYATPDGHAAFEAELNAYVRGKGSVRFPHDQPLPIDLIKRIARYRAETINERK